MIINMTIVRWFWWRNYYQYLLRIYLRWFLFLFYIVINSLCKKRSRYLEGAELCACFDCGFSWKYYTVCRKMCLLVSLQLRCGDIGAFCWGESCHIRNWHSFTLVFWGCVIWETSHRFRNTWERNVRKKCTGG